MMKVVLVGAGITTVIAFAGVIATWSVIYSTDVGSNPGIFVDLSNQNILFF